MFDPLAPLPYATAHLPGTGGSVKKEITDFLVEEVPEIQPSGEGEHLFVTLEKRGLDAKTFLDHIASTLHIPRGTIGMAGIKDARAIARQTISVPRQTEDRIKDIETGQISILDVVPHETKLRTGQLVGNRFTCLIRDPDSTAAPPAEAIFSHLQQHGLPNFFGYQRFGRASNTFALGLAIVRQQHDSPYLRNKPNKFVERLAISAVQSAIFNFLLREKMVEGRLYSLVRGQVAQVCDSGTLFWIEDVAREEGRLTKHEIAPTGPIFGAKMRRPLFDLWRAEQQACTVLGIRAEQILSLERYASGARRPYVVFPKDFSLTFVPEGFLLKFVLPPGAYATRLLEEFTRYHPATHAQDSSPQEIEAD